MISCAGHAPLKAVLFDLGETLLNPGGASPGFVHDQAEQDFLAVFAYLQGMGKALPPWRTFYDIMLGRFQERRKASFRSDESVHIGRVVRIALEEMRIPLHDVDMDRCVRLTFQYSDDHAILYPDAISLVRKLRSLGLQTGLISNTIWPGWCQDETLARLGIRDLLDARIYSADVAFAKPHPSIFLRALDMLHVPAESAVFVGDHFDPDICGAQGVGMKAIYFDVPYRQESHPIIVPDGRITSLSQVPSELARLYPNSYRKGQSA